MSLMWIFYLADIADKFVGALSLFLVAVIIFLVIMGINYGCEKDKSDNYKNEELIIILNKRIKLLLILISISTMLLVVVPSSNTIYLMAGTQQIEKLSTTEEGQKVKQALDLGLDKVIKNLKQGK